MRKIEINVCNTMGIGYCVRIHGNDMHDEINQYGCKQLRTFQIASHLESQEEAEQVAEEWLKKQISNLKTRSAG